MQITKHIHAIKINFLIPVSPAKSVERFVYLYLIYGKKIYLIDSGVASSGKMILDYIKNTGRKPEEISTIILTHSHPDHIGSAHAIKKETNCTIAAHPEEQSWFENVDLQYKERPVPGFHSLVDDSIEINHILNDGDILNLKDDIQLEIFHTPGHSKGSISLLLREDKALFSADAIPLIGNLPIYEDILACINSIKKLKTIENIHILLSSWDVPRKEDSVYQVMDEGLNYLQNIHNAVIKAANNNHSLDPMNLCEYVVRELELPEIAVNPLVAKSFVSHLKVLDQKELF
jgi:glyoxylase-like metal-dependent hydrolase (beta-lactamase superfamily II)